MVSYLECHTMHQTIAGSISSPYGRQPVDVFLASFLSLPSSFLKINKKISLCEDFFSKTLLGINGLSINIFVRCSTHLGVYLLGGQFSR